MVELLDIPIPEHHISIYDPAAGTGGMLSVAKEHLLDRALNDDDRVAIEQFLTVHGQELSPTNYAICRADLLIKNDRDAQVYLGNSLIPHDPRKGEPGDQLAEPAHHFDYMLSNPPFGVTWGGKDGYEDEARKLAKTRYRAGMPRVNDGALLFLQTMLAKMWPVGERSNASRSSSTVRLFRTVTVRRVRARSAAGSLKTTGSTPSSCCRTNFSTTLAYLPMSGCFAMTSRQITAAR